MVFELPRVDFAGGLGIEQVESLSEFLYLIFCESRPFNFLFGRAFSVVLSSHLNLTVKIDYI